MPLKGLNPSCSQMGDTKQTLSGKSFMKSKRRYILKSVRAGKVRM